MKCDAFPAGPGSGLPRPIPANPSARTLATSVRPNGSPGLTEVFFVQTHAHPRSLDSQAFLAVALCPAGVRAMTPNRPSRRSSTPPAVERHYVPDPEAGLRAFRLVLGIPPRI